MWVHKANDNQQYNRYGRDERIKWQAVRSSESGTEKSQRNYQSGKCGTRLTDRPSLLLMGRLIQGNGFVPQYRRVCVSVCGCMTMDEMNMPYF